MNWQEKLGDHEPVKIGVLANSEFRHSVKWLN